MKKLLMNKKAQIPVLSDIANFFQRAWSWFQDSAPKPLKIVIFLAFLIFLSFLFNIFLSATGNWCDTQGNEYKTGFLEVVTNFRLLISMPSNEELTSGELDPEDNYLTDATLYECTVFFPGNEGYKFKYINNGSKHNWTTDGYLHFYSKRCITCNTPVRVWSASRFIARNYCADDIAYPIPYEEMSAKGKRTCNKFIGTCGIPEGYYYDRIRNVYVCDSPLCANATNGSSTIGSHWNLRLKEHGAKIREPSPYGDKDYRNAVRIECDQGDIRPKLRFFGIEMFNYKMWVLLILLSAVIWGLYKVKHP